MRSISVPQTQAPLADQLAALEYAADKLGLYDAADYLRNRRPTSERDRLREAVVEAAKEVFKVKRPGYHDCLDDGMPECEWCLLEKALAAYESSQKEG